MGKFPQHEAEIRWFEMIRGAAKEAHLRSGAVREALADQGIAISRATVRDYWTRTLPADERTCFALLKAVRLPSQYWPAAYECWSDARRGRPPLPTPQELNQDSQIDEWLDLARDYWEAGLPRQALLVAEHLASILEAPHHLFEPLKLSIELSTLVGDRKRGVLRLPRLVQLGSQIGARAHAEAHWIAGLQLCGTQRSADVAQRMFTIAREQAARSKDQVWSDGFRQMVVRDEVVLAVGKAPEETLRQVMRPLEDQVEVTDDPQVRALGLEVLARAYLRLGEYEKGFRALDAAACFRGSHQLIFTIKCLRTRARLLDASGSDGSQARAEAVAIQQRYGFVHV